MNRLRLETAPELAAGGQAVGRAPDGRIVFIEGAAPRERVEVDVTKDNPRFLRARTREVIEASPDRVAPKCAHFGECGGCTLQYVSSQAQLRSKQAALLMTLSKIGRVEAGAVLAPWSGAPYGYRGRARWSVTPDGRPGYRHAKSSAIVAVDECPILHPVLQEVLKAVRPSAGGAPTGGRPAPVRPKRGAPTGAERFVNVVTDGTQAAAAWHPGRGPRPTHAVLTWTDAVEPEACLTADGIRLHPLAFSQANPAGNRALRAQIDSWLAALGPVTSAVELYAGSGNFTLALAGRIPSVRTFEADAAAVRLARSVLPEHVEAAVMSAEDAVAEPRPPVDIGLVDPPRAGLSPEVADALAGWARRALIYVSCDPATFARDAGRWRERGWALDRVRLFDLYPQTAHAEVAGLFIPTDPATDTFAPSPD